MENDEESGPSNLNAAEGDLEYSWQILPSCALERIYSYLNLVDRSRASVVCKAWEEAYTCPDLWQKIIIKFPTGIRRSRNAQKRIVERFGEYFKDLTIMCYNELRKNKKFAHQEMSDFFHIIEQKEVQVESFRMPRLAVLTKLNSNNQAITSESFINFLKMQTGLTKVDFTHGRAHTASGLDILENLVAENVQHLKLQKFFAHSLEIVRNPIRRRRQIDMNFPEWSERYVNAISRFRNLRSLSVNCRYLTNEVVRLLAVTLEGHLELLSLLWDSWITTTRIVLGINWRALNVKCPQMQVHYRFEPQNMKTNIILYYNFLPKQLPIASIEFVTNRMWHPYYDHAIFDYLVRIYANTLRNAEFSLQGDNDQDVREGLVHLIKNCCFLESLTWKVKFVNLELGQLFTSILDILHQQRNERGTIALKKFRAIIRGRDPNERGYKSDLKDTFFPQFSEIGVQLSIKLKK